MKNLQFRAVLVVILLFPCIQYLTSTSQAQTVVSNQNEPVFGSLSNKWVDSVFNALTPRERLGQLFMVAAYSNKGKKHIKEIRKLIHNNGIGGLIFFQGGPVRQAKLTNAFQKMSKVPLLIAMDAEWGLSMRLDSTKGFPRQMALGAIQNDSLIYEMGTEIAAEFKRIGMQLNFAPVVDINSNPNNPVIGSRSFGEQKEMVARKAMYYMKALQDHGVLANAKHFPGHGDTDADSHKVLPLISHSKDRIDSLDLFPYTPLIQNGLGSIMVAHLRIPALDTTEGLPGTLSKPIVTYLLKEKLHFKGLVITDALNMKGVSTYNAAAQVDYQALLAGNDVLLFPDSIDEAIDAIEKGIAKGELSQADVDERCKKILRAKFWSGLSRWVPIQTKGLFDDLNNTQIENINRKLVQGSLTVLQNRNDLLPIREPDTLKLLLITTTGNTDAIFQQTLAKYARFDCEILSNKATAADLDTLLKKAKGYNLVVLHIDNLTNNVAKHYNLTPELLTLADKIFVQNKTILSFPCNPYALAQFSNLANAQAIILGYESNKWSATLIPELIFGAVGANGKLPISVNAQYPFGTGINVMSLGRLKYEGYEGYGFKPAAFRKIDDIVKSGIKSKIYPGCQIVVAYKGSVIFQKSYGNHLYEKSQPVGDSDLYDLASVTKTTATLPVLMKMVDTHQLNIDDTLGALLPSLNATNKSHLKVREVLTHQSGLRDWIPFWMHTVHHQQFIPGIFKNTQDSTYSVVVAENLFMNKSYIDTLYKMIAQSEIKKPGAYRYSDLGYYYFKMFIEKEYKGGLDSVANELFYKPLGMAHTLFRPNLHHIPKDKIVPTERDNDFRKQLLHGYVHDQGAAMLGGVGGHAGLFSNASDLAILFQMYLQKGYYGGRRYLDSTTINEFTRCQYCPSNRRGLGFDKPDATNPSESPCSSGASNSSYGHTGFTGTMFWIDPEKQLVYIFLSNRVYPSAAINKLAKSGIRTQIQQVIYDAIPR